MKKILAEAGSRLDQIKGYFRCNPDTTTLGDLNVLLLTLRLPQLRRLFIESSSATPFPDTHLQIGAIELACSEVSDLGERPFYILSGETNPATLAAVSALVVSKSPIIVSIGNYSATFSPLYPSNSEESICHSFPTGEDNKTDKIHVQRLSGTVTEFDTFSIRERQLSFQYHADQRSFQPVTVPQVHLSGDQVRSPQALSVLYAYVARLAEASPDTPILFQSADTQSAEDIALLFSVFNASYREVASSLQDHLNRGVYPDRYLVSHLFSKIRPPLLEQAVTLMLYRPTLLQQPASSALINESLRMLSSALRQDLLGAPDPNGIFFTYQFDKTPTFYCDPAPPIKSFDLWPLILVLLVNIIPYILYIMGRDTFSGNHS